jgi:hypothetical protein
MLDRTEFRLTLISPLLVFLALEVFLAASSIGVIAWRGTHGRPHWSENIAIWNICANMALIVAWIAYVQVRRSRAARK